MTARMGTLPRKYAVRRWVATGIAAAVVAAGWVAVAGFGSDASTPVVARTPDTFVAATRGPDMVAAVTAPVETTAPTETTPAVPQETVPVEVPVQTPVVVPPVVQTPVAPAPQVEAPAEVVPVPTVPVAPKCQEDNPCWNSCTMGNMSPCDGTATLPYGARFQVRVDYDPLDQSCWQGWAFTTINVSVYGAEGGLLAQSGTAYGCSPGGDAFADNGVGHMLPELFRQAASQL